jgi:hypothetical protein
VTATDGTYVVGPDITGRVLWSRRFKAGFIMRREEWTVTGSVPCPLTVTYNLKGDYIGDVRTARMLCVKYGIVPEKRKPEHFACSIGYSTRKKKWFGWSHRAIYGFRTRKAAARFAESVS